MLSRTLFQIKSYQKALAKRKASERASQVRDIAVASNVSDASNFQEYVAALENLSEENDADDFGEIPQGIATHVEG